MEHHHYTSTKGQTDTAVYTAGMDLDCGVFTERSMKRAISDGELKENDVRTAIFHNALVQFRLGMFDDPQLVPWRCVRERVYL